MYFRTNVQPSVLCISLSKHFLLFEPLSVPTLSSDHNPFKILSCPSISKPCLILDYKHADWPLFCSILDPLIVTNPCIRDHTDLEHMIQDFSSAVRQAAHTAIP